MESLETEESKSWWVGKKMIIFLVLVTWEAIGCCCFILHTYKRKHVNVSSFSADISLTCCNLQSSWDISVDWRVNKPQLTDLSEETSFFFVFLKCWVGHEPWVGCAPNFYPMPTITHGICWHRKNWQNTIVPSEILNRGTQLKPVRSKPFREDGGYFRGHPGPSKTVWGVMRVPGIMCFSSVKSCFWVIASSSQPGLYQPSLKMKVEIILARWEIRCCVFKGISRAGKKINKIK